MGTLRLDKWLWAARFFKTRANAVEAIKGGKVHVNGKRVKPAYHVSIDDTLRITREPERYEITVLGLNDKRRPAKEARLLYEESTESYEARQEARELRKLNNASVVRPAKRPNKRQRREINKWRGR